MKSFFRCLRVNYAGSSDTFKSVVLDESSASNVFEAIEKARPIADIGQYSAVILPLTYSFNDDAELVLLLGDNLDSTIYIPETESFYSDYMTATASYKSRNQITIENQLCDIYVVRYYAGYSDYNSLVLAISNNKIVTGYLIHYNFISKLK